MYQGSKNQSKILRKKMVRFRWFKVRQQYQYEIFKSKVKSQEELKEKIEI